MNALYLVSIKSYRHSKVSNYMHQVALFPFLEFMGDDNYFCAVCCSAGSFRAFVRQVPRGADLFV